MIVKSPKKHPIIQKSHRERKAGGGRDLLQDFAIP